MTWFGKVFFYVFHFFVGIPLFLGTLFSVALSQDNENSEVAGYNYSNNLGNTDFVSNLKLLGIHLALLIFTFASIYFIFTHMKKTYGSKRSSSDKVVIFCFLLSPLLLLPSFSLFFYSVFVALYIYSIFDGGGAPHQNALEIVSLCVFLALFVYWFLLPTLAFIRGGKNNRDYSNPKQ